MVLSTGYIDGNKIFGLYSLPDGTGSKHGFIATIPEPATMCLLALGGWIVLWQRIWK